MPAQDTTIWGIHAGRTGAADSLFLKGACVALGWKEMGNLSAIQADRDSFKAKVATTFPQAKPGAIPNFAGQLFRFVHEVKRGDIIVYPSQLDRQIHIGRIDGAYEHDPTRNSDYPNIRGVKWLKAIPRTHFSQGALFEVGSAMSFFQVRNYADEFRSALDASAQSASALVADDQTISVVAEEIEETTRDFIVKTLAQDLKGHPFAHFVAHLLNAMGYRCRTSPEGVDGGIDIVAHKDELGFEPPIIKVQVKSTEGSVGDPVVSALYGKVGAGEFGLFVTLGTFTSQAKTFARGRTNLRLIDGNELVDLILQHYESFDLKHKGALPLRRVYVPEPLRGAED